MILEELTLHNFGVFGGRQTVRLAPPSEKKPIVLIGGLNGGGKTTLLEALQIALFGKLARSGGRGSGSGSESLRRSINRGVDETEGAAIELQLAVYSEGVPHTYRIHRSWAVSKSGAVREHLEVLRDGTLDAVLTESWAEHVEEIMPLQVSPLFFFDGERVEELADPDRSAGVLTTAVQSLLGLDLVERLITDLRVLEQRKKTSARSDEARRRIEVLERDARQKLEMQAAAKQRLAEAQNELDECSKKKRELDRTFRADGGELFERRGQLEAQHERLRSRATDLENELRHIAAGSAPLGLVPELLSSLAAQVDREETARTQSELIELLEVRDAETLERAARAGGSKKLLTALERSMARDRKARATAAAERPIHEMARDARARLHELRTTLLPHVDEQVERLTSQLRGTRRELDDCERLLAGVPDEGSIASLLEERAKVAHELAAARARHQSLQEEYERASRDVERAEGQLRRAHASDVDQQMKFEDAHRLVHHSERVRGTMESFRKAVIERHIAEISRLVLDSFRQLLRKEMLVTHLEIDPATFRMRLRNARGDEITPGELSAGERQLLAVSLLWGLARASGRPLPAVIDTPLGRLDSEHRSHLVERYFPYASHQVLLLSTDEEIDDAYYPMLKQWVGREYLLEYDDVSGSTTVRKGYFA